MYYSIFSVRNQCDRTKIIKNRFFLRGTTKLRGNILTNDQFYAIMFYIRLLWALMCLTIATLWQKEFIMFETLKKILIDEMQVEENAITMEAELTADLGLNSIELANLVMMCEDKFDITIEDEDIHKFLTVGDVVNFLENV